MRLSDLLEVVAGSLRTDTDLPLSFAITNRFVRDFLEFEKAFPPLGEEFLSFLETKRTNIDQPYGKKDSQWGGGMIKGITGWWHCHLHFGKAVLIYKPVGRTLILAAVVDHLSVEGHGRKIQALGEYLKKIDWDPNAPDVKRKQRTTPLTNINDQQLITNLKLGDDTVSATPSSKDLESRVKELFYDMAAEPVDRQLLADFVTGKSQEIFFFFEIMEPPISQDSLDHTKLVQIAKSALAATAARA